MTPSLFITATDTGVGKTFVGSLLAEALLESGKTVSVLKPFSAGDREDAKTLARAAGRPGAWKDATLLYCPRPLAPGAQLGLGSQGKKTVQKVFTKSVAALKDLQKNNDTVLVEGLGGILAPLGTVGKRTAGAKMPASQRAAERERAFASSPTIRGTMGP